MSNLIEQLATARGALADAERRAAEAKQVFGELAQREPLGDEKSFADARAKVSSAQADAEAARRRLEELEKLRGVEHQRLINEAAALIRADWKALGEGRARRARLHELVEAETALLEPSNSFGGPPLRRRIGVHLGSALSFAGIFGIDNPTFERAQVEWQEFLQRMVD